MSQNSLKSDLDKLLEEVLFPRNPKNLSGMGVIFKIKVKSTEYVLTVTDKDDNKGFPKGKLTFQQEETRLQLVIRKLDELLGLVVKYRKEVCYKMNYKKRSHFVENESDQHFLVIKRSLPNDIECKIEKVGTHGRIMYLYVQIPSIESENLLDSVFSITLNHNNLVDYEWVPVEKLKNDCDWEDSMFNQMKESGTDKDFRKFNVGIRGFLDDYYGNLSSSHESTSSFSTSPGNLVSIFCPNSPYASSFSSPLSSPTSSPQKKLKKFTDEVNMELVPNKDDLVVSSRRKLNFATGFDLSELPPPSLTSQPASFGGILAIDQNYQCFSPKKLFGKN